MYLMRIKQHISDYFSQKKDLICKIYLVQLVY